MEETENYLAAQSPTLSLFVGRLQSGVSFSLAISSASVDPGQPVQVTASLTPALSTGTIELQYSVDGQTWTRFSAGQPSGGVYASSWTPPEAKRYSVRASWGGDQEFLGSTTQPVALSVGREFATVNIDRARLELDRVGTTISPEAGQLLQRAADELRSAISLFEAGDYGAAIIRAQNAISVAEQAKRNEASFSSTILNSAMVIGIVAAVGAGLYFTRIRKYKAV
jgi:hypothetical protein